MNNDEVWVAECFLQNQSGHDYKFHAAVLANGYDKFRSSLITHIASSGLRLLWIEECFPAPQYVARYPKYYSLIGQLVRSIHAGHPVEISKGTLISEVAEPEEPSFKETLLGMNYKVFPVFAVLDGAQFDHLPQALFDGDFISRSLYIDRGDNNPEQIITAPHLVWLDEQAEKPNGRSYDETVEALLSLIGDKPAAVFWQCPKGDETLFKHLRGINMIMIPKTSLPADLEPDDTDSHAMVLFRHADANVIAQTMGAMDKDELTRFFGPANAIICAPNPDWIEGKNWYGLKKSGDESPRKNGPLRLSQNTIEKITGIRLNRRHYRIIKYLKKVLPEEFKTMTDKDFKEKTNRFMNDAKVYGIKSEAALGRWCYLQIITKGEIGKKPEIIDFITGKNPGLNPAASADERVKTIMAMASQPPRR